MQDNHSKRIHPYLIMRNFKLFLALLTAFGHVSHAQNLHVTAVFPSNQVIQASAQTEITVQFDQAVDPSSVSGTAFRVFGRWSGPMTGTISYENDGQFLRFVPDGTFIAGEFVNVMLSRQIASAGGDPLPHGYAWGFWILTAPGILNQPFDYMVELRQPGEFTLQTYGAYAGDLNNDGYSDLTIVNETSDDLRIMINDGTGHYSDFTVIPMGNSTPSPSEGCDINNDGEIDLVVTTAWDNQIRTFFGHGDGTLTDMETYYNGDGARGVAVLDFNGDGWDDFFVVNRLSNDLTLMTNDGAGGFSIADSDTDCTGETAVMAADANFDGITDLFVGCYYSDEILLLTGDGDGHFNVSDAASVGGQPWMISAGDFNNDGFTDVASANSSGNSISVVFGDGAGGLGNAATFTGPGIQFPLALDAGDIDGDGDLDLASSNYGSTDFTIFENNGQGVFSVGATLQAEELSSCAILHDRDNDGDLDITGTDEGADVVIFFINPATPVPVSEPANATASLKMFPNPFDREISISADLSAGSRLRISHVLGHSIRSYTMSDGTISWDGRDAGGNDVPAGIYLLSVVNEVGQVMASGMAVKYAD